MNSKRYRYGSYAGGADPLAPPYDVRDAVDRIGEQVLAGESFADAVRRVLREGRDGRGLADLEARARRMRREALRRGRLDGTLTQSQALLDQALATERDALEDVEDQLAADFARTQLDALPPQTAAAIQELKDYQWTSPQAKAMYEQILEQLRSQVLEQQFAGMKQTLSHSDQQGNQAVAEMLDDLNALLDKHSRSEDTDADFDEFMAKHGQFFPDDPKNVDELIDSLARQAAAAQQLMNSLRPEQRAELASLIQQAMANNGLGERMAALNQHLRDLRPDLQWNRGQRMNGEEPLGYGDATQALGEVADLERLLEQLGQDHPGATLDDVDVDLVSKQLGRGAADQVQRLAELERELKRQGWLTGNTESLQLSPKAIRRLGQTALRQVFAELEGSRRGGHDQQSAGAAGEPTGSTRTWEFGDSQPLDPVRTIQRALRRGLPAPGERVSLQVADFEVVETERRSGAAVALCVDLSYSMISQGRWGPMKQTALALHHLVSTQFPQDALQLIGFGRYAQPLTINELAAIEPDYEQGTNLSHALALARRHLSRHPGMDPIVLVVTDGEPTAHLMDDGTAWFNWPPDAETIESAVREVDAVRRAGARLNIFMLGEDLGLQRFCAAMTRRANGHLYAADPGELGRFVVADYLARRSSSRA